MTTTPHRTKVRSSIAVFHYTGTEWIIVRGIKGEWLDS
jgi:ribosomal protein S24E